MRTRDLNTGLESAEIGKGSPGGLPLLLRGVSFLAAFLAALALSVPALAQEGGKGREATLRVAHLSPDAPKVDVYVDDEPVEALSNMSFKSVSSYLPLPAGSRNVKVYLADDSSGPLLEANVDLDGGASYTLGVVGRIEDGSLAAKLYEDDNSPPAKGKAKLRMIHAVQGLGAVTVGVKEDREDLFALPGFSNASDYAEIPAGTHTLEVRLAGTDDVAYTIPDVTLSAGEIYTAFAVGRPEEGPLSVIFVGRGGGIGGREGNKPQDNKEKPRYEEQRAGANGSGQAATPAGDETGARGPGVEADAISALCLQDLHIFAPTGPPTSAAAWVDNNLLGATTPAVKGSTYEGAVVLDTTQAVPELAYQEPVYQYPLYQEEPFIAAPIVPEMVYYQQPIGEPLIPSLSATMPDAVGDPTAMLGMMTKNTIVQESFSSQEPTQMAEAGQTQATSGVSIDSDAGSSVRAEIEPIGTVNSSSANTIKQFPAARASSLR